MSRVGDELAALRDRAGMSRKVLADLSGLSPGTIQLIENGDTAQPEPETLRRLSVGLATNRATGKVDDDVAAQLYDGFMAAAGYSLTSSAEGAMSLESTITSVVRSPTQAAKLAAFVRKYPNMSANQRRLVDALLDNLEED